MKTTTSEEKSIKNSPMFNSIHVGEPLYQNGFGNVFETEAVTGALPRGRNNPLPLQLYAEQLSGTAFTKPRCANLRSWLYRIMPSVSGYSTGVPYETFQMSSPVNDDDSSCWFGWHNCNTEVLSIDPNPFRWKPPMNPSKDVDFIQGTFTYLASGDVATKSGLAIHLFAFNSNMTSSFRRQAIYNSDGDFLLVPQQESLHIQTEFGILHVHVGEICVLPRGVVFSVNILNSKDVDNFCVARGYILEIFKGHFELPDLGPIGSNGLANSRDFQYPVSCYDKNVHGDYKVINKFCNKLFVRSQNHSPFNVIAWHGNYAPFKYDLSKFCCVSSVTYDHPDPSIFTVLTAKSDEIGTALADFVIFPPRWMCTENTFRPPWFHRNCMSEFMGMIYGSYDAKSCEEFGPGCSSLHNVMTPHGPDRETVEKEEIRSFKEEGKLLNAPAKFVGGLAFMFETSMTLKLTQHAIDSPTRDREYASCWHGIKDKFTG